MHDIKDLLEIIKTVSIEAVESKKPSGVLFGTVINDAPLKILIEQKLILGLEQLVLCRNVADFKLMMTVNHETESKGGGGGYSAYESHSHDYKGKKEFLVHNKLVKGDKVLLISQQGGQKFIVVDRVVTE